jgi:hypothetical protein
VIISDVNNLPPTANLASKPDIWSPQFGQTKDRNHSDHIKAFAAMQHGPPGCAASISRAPNICAGRISAMPRSISSVARATCLCHRDRSRFTGVTSGRKLINLKKKLKIAGVPERRRPLRVQTPNHRGESNFLVVARREQSRSQNRARRTVPRAPSGDRLVRSRCVDR